MARFETRSAAETEAAGAALAARLSAGDVVLVSGELGSGKTTFVRGACRALGVSEPVTSPTFTLGQLYRTGAGSDPPGARPAAEIAHLDLYRLSTLHDDDPALLDDYLTPERLAFVEWPALAETELGESLRLAARVRIEHAGGEDDRLVEITEPAPE